MDLKRLREGAECNVRSSRDCRVAANDLLALVKITEAAEHLYCLTGFRVWAAGLTTTLAIADFLRVMGRNTTGMKKPESKPDRCPNCGGLYFARPCGYYEYRPCLDTKKINTRRERCSQCGQTILIVTEEEG